MSSKVYFMDDHAMSTPESTPFKALKLLRDAGIETLFKKGAKVGIKVHFGEYGNSANLRPHWISPIVDEVKRLGGNPVVFDCCTAPFAIYSSRAVASDHLRTASSHGFNEETIGCPIEICDGEYGQDQVEVEVPHGTLLKRAWMGKGILEFDAVIVVSHFKGHPMGVYGGALKNVGIGMGSPRGKLATHFFTHPTLGKKAYTINQEVVKKLAEAPHPNIIDMVLDTCVHGVYEWKDGMLEHHADKCKLCGLCFPYSSAGLFNTPPEVVPTWAPTIADAAAGFINAIGAENMLYLNYAFDVTPWCDCASFHDRAMVPNIGTFASKDPVAVDMACMEAAEEKVAVPGSVADTFEFKEPNTERFTNCSSFAKQSQWQQINAAVYNGIGSAEYVLVNSVPLPEEELWFPPYVPGRSLAQVHKEAFGKIDNECGDFFYDESKVPMDKLNKKPLGKVSEISIEEDNAEAGLA